MKASLQLSSQSHRSSRLATFVFQCALLLALLIPSGRVWGQTLVVDGSGTNQYVPMYNYYNDYGHRSEYIIPASYFSSAGISNGASLTSMTLYRSATGTWTAKNLTIKLTNTSTSYYSSTSFLGLDGTTVYTNSSYSGGTSSSYTFTFSSPFTYTGGSLVVHISADNGGTCSSSSSASTWYGISSTSNYQGCYASGSSSASATTGTRVSFLPKTAFTYTPPTCTPSFGSNTDCITNFTLGSINNSTASSSTNGYGDYTSQSTNLSQGSTVSASLTSGAGSGTHAAAVWIDFNNDGEFSSEERVGTQGSIGASATVNISLTIPDDAATGSHRLRVVYQYNTTATSISPCASATYGEGEDYTVNITAAANATLSWSNPTGGTISVTKSGSSVSSGSVVSGTVNITATPSSGYVFAGWSVTGGATLGSSTSATTTITMGSANAPLTAAIRYYSVG